MSRVKGGVHALKRRRSVLAMVKGFRHGRGTKEKLARESMYHAYNHAFAHRRRKKSEARSLWNIKIGGALSETGFSYSKFIGALGVKEVVINRKMLAFIAEKRPELFTEVVNFVK